LGHKSRILKNNNEVEIKMLELLAFFIKKVNLVKNNLQTKNTKNTKNTKK